MRKMWLMSSRDDSHDPMIPSGASMVESSGSQQERLSRPVLFMEIARLFGKRSTCPRAAVGVIAVTAGRVVASGYVGSPAGTDHCFDVGCLIGDDGGCIRSVHAEANLVAWAARIGTALEGSEIYCTHSPCLACAKLMGNAGITHLTYDEEYRISDGINLLRDLGVGVEHTIWA